MIKLRSNLKVVVPSLKLWKELLAPESAINAFGPLFQQRVKIEEHPTFFLPSLKASSPSVVDEVLKKCSD